MTDEQQDGQELDAAVLFSLLLASLVLPLCLSVRRSVHGPALCRSTGRHAIRVYLHIKECAERAANARHLERIQNLKGASLANCSSYF